MAVMPGTCGMEANKMGKSRTAGRRLLAGILLVVLLTAGLGVAPAARAATINVPAGDVDALIAALAAANDTPGPDVIVLAAGATYTLTEGTIQIASPVKIVGNGATLTLSDTAPEFSILSVAAETSATLQQVRISNGRYLFGSGINNAGTLTLIDSLVSDNYGSFAGAGIFNTGTMTLIDSTVNGNDAEVAGGIINFATMTLINSTVSNNTAESVGGGIGNIGTLTLTNSTISGNSAGENTGGMINEGTLTLTNSTVSGNSAANDGGGIVNTSTATLTNTLVAGNTSQTGPDISGTVSGTFNLIGDGSGMTGLMDGFDGNQVGTSQAPIDPRLGPLADNGGPTQTHLPGLDSPAINAADTASGPDTDQRGVSRPYSDASDIGAVEVQLHSDLCALTQAKVREAAVARSACAMLQIAQVAEQQGNVMLEQLAVTNYQLQIRSAQGRRYISSADAAMLMNWATFL